MSHEREVLEDGIKERMKRAMKIAELVLTETGHGGGFHQEGTIAVSILAVRIYDEINMPKKGIERG